VATGKKYGGRVKGTPNKATLKAREAIAEFLDANAHRLQEWLEAVAVDDPKGALTCFKDLLEYHVPKLGRTELTGKDGGPLGVKIVRFSDLAEQLDAASVSDESVVRARTGMPSRRSGVAQTEREG
jgi:hypothetical protein